jgi:undecaprenyl-phosphate 4-deoxy-4-formamido-L-arabinose transferase
MTATPRPGGGTGVPGEPGRSATPIGVGSPAGPVVGAAPGGTAAPAGEAASSDLAGPDSSAALAASAGAGNVAVPAGPAASASSGSSGVPASSGITAESAIFATPGGAVTASIVIPVYNEEANLAALYARLAPVMDGIAGGAEAIFVDDGSADRSLELLRGLAAADPRLRVISFNRNYGQHAAVMAGLEVTRGETVVTLDADLQNPPEDIPKLLAKAAEGFDVVGGWRADRKDTWFRRWASRQINRMMRRILAGVEFRDYGCMLRAYSRPVVESLRRCEERTPFIPALACQFARRIAEVPVGHAERAAGESKYSFWRLLKLQADLVTGFTSMPLRLATLAGTLISLLSIGFGVFLVIRRLIQGPEAEGLFTLFAILFLLVGADFLALGVLGEYVGRIYVEVRRRPRSVVKETVNLEAGRREP